MNDKQFMTIFLGVMGVLTIIFFVIFFVAQIVAPEKKAADEFTNNAVVSRIEPIGKLNYSGSNDAEANLDESMANTVRELRCDETSENKIHLVKMLNEGNQGSMVFEPAFIKINAGDSITFEMTDAGHNAVTVAGPTGSAPFDTKYKPSTTVKFDVKGIYLYKCTPHAMMAMAGLIQVSDASNKEAMISEIEKFEGTVMMPNVKTRISDLFKANVK